MNFAGYYKALVPVIVAGALSILGYIGVGPDVSVKEALTLFVTGAIVYLVPNKK